MSFVLKSDPPRQTIVLSAVLVDVIRVAAVWSKP